MPSEATGGCNSATQKRKQTKKGIHGIQEVRKLTWEVLGRQFCSSAREQSSPDGTGGSIRSISKKYGFLTCDH